MQRRNVIIFIAVIAVIVLLAAVLFANRRATPAVSPQPSPSPSVRPSAAALASPSPSAATSLTVTYTTSGFSPAAISINSGTKLTFKNDTSDTIQVDSNPHPQHTDNPELNIGTIAPGASASVTPTKDGVWKIHNHLDSAMQATITVQ